MSVNQLPFPAYQQALYYPYVRFRDPHWMKVAALYWDGILRMVPPFMQKEDLESRDDPFVQELRKGDQDLVRPIFLSQDDSSLWASRRILDMVKDADAHPGNQSPYATALHPAAPGELTYAIALSFGLDEFYKEFVDRGLARYENDKKTIFFEPTLGQTFMALLATTVASRFGVPVASNVVVYNDLLRAEILSGNISTPEVPLLEQPSSKLVEGSVQERLATIAFEVVVPDPMSLDTLSVDQILQFRSEYADERRAFFNFVKAMAEDLSTNIDVTDLVVLQDRLSVYGPQLKKQTQKLREGLKATGIDAVSQTISIDGKMPLLAVGTSVVAEIAKATGTVPMLPQTPTLAAITAVGGLAVGLYQVSTKWRQARATLREEQSPYSYLLALDELTRPRSLLKKQRSRLAGFFRGR